MNKKKLFIYLISQEINNDYDTYDSAVVIAESEEAAKLVHPSGRYLLDTIPWYEKNNTEEWTIPEFVEVSLVGEAREGCIAGSVVCASFNAG